MKKGNLLLYPNWKENFQNLPAEVAQEILVNLFSVIETGEIPELQLSYLDTYEAEGPQTPVMQQIIKEMRKSYEGQYMSMAKVVLQDSEAYTAKCEKNRQNRLKAFKEKNGIEKKEQEQNKEDSGLRSLEFADDDDDMDVRKVFPPVPDDDLDNFDDDDDVPYPVEDDD